MSKNLTVSERIYNSLFGSKEKNQEKPNESIVTAARTFRDNASRMAGKDPTKMKRSTTSSRGSRKQSSTSDKSTPISVEELLKSKGYGGKKRTLRKKTNKRKTKKSNRK